MKAFVILLALTSSVSFADAKTPLDEQAAFNMLWQCAKNTGSTAVFSKNERRNIGACNGGVNAVVSIDSGTLTVAYEDKDKSIKYMSYFVPSKSENVTLSPLTVGYGSPGICAYDFVLNLSTMNYIDPKEEVARLTKANRVTLPQQVKQISDPLVAYQAMSGQIAKSIDRNSSSNCSKFSGLIHRSGGTLSSNFRDALILNPPVEGAGAANKPVGISK
jgi:hypothetical protein